MTPMIDIIFLLIIFFMVVCQFFVAENFEISVPDDISNSDPKNTALEQRATVSVFYNEDGKLVYAVGSDMIQEGNATEISSKIAKQLDDTLDRIDSTKKIVDLRISRNITFHDYQYALAGIAQSRATDMKLAVFKEENALAE